MTTSTTHTGQRALRDHAPQIADSLLSAHDQRTRLHRAMQPPASAKPSMAEWIADSAPEINVPALLAGLVGIVAFFAAIVVIAISLFRLATGG